MTSRLGDFFEIRSGDFHATKELDPGQTPLVSCGDTNNGFVGYFDIPKGKTYERSITVAYNGSWPLLAKYHPYVFGAKDDVAVLIPRGRMRQITLFYVATMLNRQTWRYSYGRKCFFKKLKDVRITVPVKVTPSGKVAIDEAEIGRLCPRGFRSFLPDSGPTEIVVPRVKWGSFCIVAVFDIQRGDFHSISNLHDGPYMTVSRVNQDNGVVGYFDRPDGTWLYPRGCLTVSTVGGDAFVQLDDFMATDNVVVCTPKNPLRIATLFFFAFVLNRQKWRYSYGRQCYSTKLARVSLCAPVTTAGDINEDAIETIVSSAPYWALLQRRFPGN